MRLVIRVAAITLVAAGCGDDGYGGGGSDSTTEPTEVTGTTAAPEDAAAVFDRDACALLTDAQAAELLGDGVTKEATPGDAATAQPASCTWSGPDATVDFADPQPTALTVFLERSPWGNA